MGLFGGDSKSEPKFIPAQKEFASALFQPGGFFWSLLQGGPNAGIERGIARGQEGLVNGLAQQGLTGSGLAAKALTGYQTQAAGQRQDNLVQILANVMRPTGVSSSSSSGTFGL